MMQEPYRPWYFRRKAPIFCDCWKVFYNCMYPIKKSILVISALVIIVGTVILVGALIACIAGYCRGGVVALWPLAVFFLWFGLMFFHCGWAAHLLDDRDGIGRPKDAENNAPFVQREEYDENGEIIQPKTNIGYWQFVDQPAWQDVASRDNLQ